MNESGSPRGSLNVNDLKKLAATSVIVGAAAALSYFGQNLSGIDFGDSTGIVVGIIVVFIDVFVKFISNNAKN